MRKASLHILTLTTAGGAIILALSFAMGNAGWLNLPRFARQQAMPDFARIADVGIRKQIFIEYLLPHVNSVNRTLEIRRYHVNELYNFHIAGHDLKFYQRKWLRKIAREYGIKFTNISDKEIWNQLRQRVEPIPTSLVLAQAALESGWGGSRFAQQGNNLFGHWCYISGCGIVPERRNEGEIHEVRRFATVQESIWQYAHNLNTHNAYDSFRYLRNRERVLYNGAIRSDVVAKGLKKYSSLGDEYIQRVLSVISGNNLNRFDKKISKI